MAGDRTIVVVLIAVTNMLVTRRFVRKDFLYLGKHPSGTPLFQPVIRLICFFIHHRLVDLRDRVVQCRLASTLLLKHAEGYCHRWCVVWLYALHKRNEHVSLAVVEATFEKADEGSMGNGNQLQAFSNFLELCSCGVSVTLSPDCPVPLSGSLEGVLAAEGNLCIAYINGSVAAADDECLAAQAGERAIAHQGCEHFVGMANGEFGTEAGVDSLANGENKIFERHESILKARRCSGVRV
ncbi:hypothetical protein D3C76_431450 [compost metagenome]